MSLINAIVFSFNMLFVGWTIQSAIIVIALYSLTAIWIGKFLDVKPIKVFIASIFFALFTYFLVSTINLIN